MAPTPAQTSGFDFSAMMNMFLPLMMMGMVLGMVGGMMGGADKEENLSMAT